jgi:hypothetical protein
MKPLEIPFIPQQKHLHSKLPLQTICFEPWNTTDKPSCNAEFSISHYDTGLSINYIVTEQVLLAKKRKINGEVHKDNCVEFFIAFGNDAGYYNFEFNCLGSVKAAFGKNRQRRRYIPEKLLKIVEDNVIVAIDNMNSSKGIKWNIAVNLPLSVFYHHNITSLSGLTCTANFAKCGDDLPIPHFLSWVNIVSENPDFHQPLSFGEVTFMKKDFYIPSVNLTQAV